MHMLMHFTMPPDMPASAHIVQACSHAEHASMHSCIIIMSMEVGIPAISLDMFCIICAVRVMARTPSRGCRAKKKSSHETTAHI
jgi:hypothetical protein